MELVQSDVDRPNTRQYNAKRADGSYRSSNNASHGILEPPTETLTHRRDCLCRVLLCLFFGVHKRCSLRRMKGKGLSADGIESLTY
jgi:hypothetical protein